MKKQSKPLALPSSSHTPQKDKESSGRIVATVSTEVETFYTNMFPKRLKSAVINQVSIGFMKYCDKVFGGINRPLNDSDTIVLLSEYINFISSQTAYSQYRK